MVWEIVIRQENKRVPVGKNEGIMLFINTLDIGVYKYKRVYLNFLVIYLLENPLFILSQLDMCAQRVLITTHRFLHLVSPAIPQHITCPSSSPHPLLSFIILWVLLVQPVGVLTELVDFILGRWPQLPWVPESNDNAVLKDIATLFPML